MADCLATQRANFTISAFTLQIVTVSLREWKVAISTGNDWRNGGYWTQNRPVSSAGDTDARETSTSLQTVPPNWTGCKLPYKMADKSTLWSFANIVSKKMKFFKKNIFFHFSHFGYLFFHSWAVPLQLEMLGSFWPVEYYLLIHLPLESHRTETVTISFLIIHNFAEF